MTPAEYGSGFDARVSATVAGAAARVPAFAARLAAAGVQAVYNLYAEAGYGFAEHVCEVLDEKVVRK